MSSKRSAFRGTTLALAIVLFAPPVLSADEVCEAGDPGIDSPVLRAETRVEPEYPEGATARGRAILRLLIDVDGRVSAVEPVRLPYGGDDLGRAAEEAVRRWRYEPATREGKPIACWVVASVEFFPAAAAPPAPSRPEPAPPPGDRPAAAPPRPESAPPADDRSEAAPPRPESAPPADDRSEAAAPPGAATAATKPSPPRPPAGDRVIEPGLGGPPPLLLGAPGGEVAKFLGVGLSGDLLVAGDRGIEVRLDGDGRVSAIRYVYTAADGHEPCRYRTRSGLGSGSLCLGIPPAHGRPQDRQQEEGADGAPVTRLVYGGDGARATFLCIGSRLTELLLESD